MARAIGPMPVVDTILFYFLAFSGSVVVIGDLLSLFGLLSEPEWWLTAATTFALLLAVLLVYSGKRPEGPRSFREVISNTLFYFSASLGSLNLARLRYLYSEFSGSYQLLVVPSLVTLALIGVVNLVLVVFSVPHAGDSILYHLTRMAYYLQHGTMKYFAANHWAYVCHPTNSTVMFLYVYLLTDRSESLVQLVQFRLFA